MTTILQEICDSYLWLSPNSITPNSMPQDPESQRSTREIAEQQARKSALTMAGSIVRVATELMIMGLGVGDESAIEVLGTAPLITMLLPLVLSHIGPVATSDPRVCMSALYQPKLSYV